MGYTARLLDVGMTGCDTIFKFTPPAAARLAASQILGKNPAFVFRYASLGRPSPADATADEIAAVTSAGMAFLLVQHAHGPDGHPWTASAAQGHADAAAAIAHAKLIGYLPGCTIAFDLEDCASVGQAVIDHATAWADDVRAAGFSPALYVGYAAGLSAAQLAALPFDAFWSDYGSRSVAPKVFSAKQHAQTSVVGIGIDADEILAPGLVGMVDVDLYIQTADPVNENAERDTLPPPAA